MSAFVRARVLPFGATLFLIAVTLLGCGSSEDAPAGTGGSGNSAGISGCGGCGGGIGGGGTGGVGDGGLVDGGGGGCLDIHVLTDILPPGPLEWWPGSAGQMQRDTLWRDEHGLHFAWNANLAPDGAIAGARLVLSTFDPGTGAAVDHRVFASFGFGGVARSPAGIVCLGGDHVEEAGVVTGALLINQNDAQVETFVPLYSSNELVLHVGWDGEAFAVHVWGSTGLEVSRVSPAGQVLLPPTVFGVSAGFQPDLRMSTDPVSGVSFAVSGEFVPVPWISAHTRDGSPVPGTETQGGKILPVQGDLGQAKSVDFTTVRGVPGGALVAWGVVGNPDGMMVVQEIDAALEAKGDVVLVPPSQHLGFDEIKNWITIQQEPNGWWAAASGGFFLEGIRLEGNALTVDNLSTYELARAGQKILDFRFLASARWDDELWLGFEDHTAQGSWGKPYLPYRIVRILPGCVYPSVWDLAQAKR